VDETLKLPVEADTAAFVANLARAAEALEKLALANQQSANKTEKNDKALEGLGEKLDALKSRTKDGIEVISQWAERINAAIEKVAELSDEGDRLARTQENLGVSLEQAQSNAVGFADETEIATAALTLQERGIRVTQQELNALTRIASSYARTTGKELGEVMENLAETVTEGGEELGKFDLALLDVADGTHTAQERLDAMVRRAREIPDAADSATDSFRRLKDEVHDLGVEAANTFVHEFERVNEIPGEINRARDATVDWHEALKDTAEVIAQIVAGSVNAIGAIVGMSATGVATIVNLGRAGANAASTLYREIRSGNVTGAVGAAGQAFNDDFAANMQSPEMRRLLAFTQAREDVIAQLIAGGPGGSGGDAAEGPDMVFTREQVAADARNQSARNRVGSPARNRNRRKTLEQLMDAAGGRLVNPRDLFRGDSSPDLAVLDEDFGTESAFITANAGKSAAQRAVNEAAFGQTDDARMRDRRRESQAQREQREQERRLDQRETFLERWERLNQREIIANDVLAESMSMGFNVITTSFSDHLRTLLEGNEAGAQFWEKMAADTMAALGKEAFGKSAFYAAESLGFLVMGNLPQAGTAAAASVAYGVAGAALTYGAAEMGAFAPETKGASGGGSAGGGSPSRPRLSASGSDTGGQNTTTVVNHYYSPVIGGRESSNAEVGTRLGRYEDARDRRVRRDRS
jgi:hypothetical protein